MRKLSDDLQGGDQLVVTCAGGQDVQILLACVEVDRHSVRAYVLRESLPIVFPRGALVHVSR